MNIANEDIKEVWAGIPDGHTHVRTRVVLHDGTEFVFQEATVANIVRAYIMLKTDPVRTSVRLKGKKLEERKEGYAEWQLVEE